MSEDVDTGIYPVIPRRPVLPFLWPAIVILLAAVTASAAIENGRVMTVVLAAIVILLGGFWAIFLFSQRQIITADAIEAKSLFGVRRLLRTDVSGCRQIPGARFSAPALLVVARDGQSVRIPKADDATLGTWIDSLADIDEAERQAGLAELEANPALGASLTVRVARIQAIRNASKVLQFAAALSLVFIFWQGAPEIFAFSSALAPLIALAIAFVLSRLRYESLGGRQQKVETRWLILPSTCLPLAGMGLGFHLVRLQLLSPWVAVEAGLLLGLPVAAAAMWLDRSHLRARSAWLPLFIVVGAVAWAAGTLAEFDIAADRAPAPTYVTPIIEKHIEHHSRSADTYRVTLAPWKGMNGSVAVFVSSDLYDRLSKGEPMCATQHPGALGFAWFEERPCPGAQPSAPPNRAVHSAT